MNSMIPLTPIPDVYSERLPISPTLSPKMTHSISNDSFKTLSQVDYLEYYAGLPSSQQNNLLLSLLNESPFSTLQSVSSWILPRLKRDFLSGLPLEVSLYILSFVDLRSLGRVGVVCKNWNIIIQGPGADLAIWKKRCLDEGFLASNTQIPRKRALSTADLKMELYGDAFRNDLVRNGHQYRQKYRHHHRIRMNWFNGIHSSVSFPGHDHHVVTCLQFDDDKIVSGSDDMTIHIYSTLTGSLLNRLLGHQGGVWALQYHNSTLVSGSTDRTLRIWDMNSGECTHVFTGHTSTVRCLAIIQPPQDLTGHPGCPLIVTGSRDSTVRVWRLPTLGVDPNWISPDSLEDGQAAFNPFYLRTLSGHSHSVRAIAGHGSTLVSGSYDCTVRVWNILTGECRHVFRGHREKVYSVGYCKNLDRAVSGSMDTTVKVWCIKTGVNLFTLEGHNLLVGLLELTPQYLVSAAADSTLRIWSPETGECLASLTGHTGAITCFHHDPKYNRIVSGSEGGVKVWELSSNGYSLSGSAGATMSRKNAFGSSTFTSTSLASNLNGIIPKSSTLGSQLSFKQGPDGPEPVYGRFIGDIVTQVSGVWRVRMDEKRLVCAVQREDGQTYFEVLDFEAGGKSVMVEEPFVEEVEVVPEQHIRQLDRTQSQDDRFMGINTVPMERMDRSVPMDIEPAHIIPNPNIELFEDDRRRTRGLRLRAAPPRLPRGGRPAELTLESPIDNPNALAFPFRVGNNPLNMVRENADVPTPASMAPRP